MFVMMYLEQNGMGINYSQLIYNLIMADCYLHNYCSFGDIYVDNILVNDVDTTTYEQWVNYYLNCNNATNPEYIASIIELDTLIINYPEIIYDFKGSENLDDLQIRKIYLDAIYVFISRLFDFFNLIINKPIKIHVSITEISEQMFIELPIPQQ